MGVPPEDLQAAIEARRELGPEREQEVVEAFLDRIDKGLDRRIDERLGRRRARGPASGPPPAVITIVSLGIAIPLLGIAGGTTGLAGIAFVCAALVLVNWIVWRHS